MGVDLQCLTQSWTHHGRREKYSGAGRDRREKCWGQGTREKFPTLPNVNIKQITHRGPSIQRRGCNTNTSVNLPWHFRSDVFNINKDQQWQTVTLQVAGLHLSKPDISHWHFYFAYVLKSHIPNSIMFLHREWHWWEESNKTWPKRNGPHVQHPYLSQIESTDPVIQVRTISKPVTMTAEFSLTQFPCQSYSNIGLAL